MLSCARTIEPLDCHSDPIRRLRPTPAQPGPRFDQLTRLLAAVSDAPAAKPLLSERERAAILAVHGCAEVDGDPELAAITRFAAELCATPIALVTLVGSRTQWSPARTGFDANEGPREGSLCAHAMLHDGILQIPDARTEARFADSPAVTGEPHVRFYAGAPLVSDEGAPLGSLCVMDPAPRAGLSDVQRHGLEVLARAALGVLRARRTERDGSVAAERARRERDDQEARFGVLADTMPQMVWSTLPDGYHDYYNARWYEFTGMPSGSTDGEAWNGMFHPQDQERAWARWRQSLATGDPYEIEYRLRAADGNYRWVLGRALPMRDADGRIVRWFGTCTDIEEQKLALEQREIISQELSHRIKNIFSVVGGLVSLSARARPEFKPIADDLRERVMALGRAHDHVRPHSPKSRPRDQPSTLQGMLHDMLAPYRTRDDARIVIKGDEIAIDDRSTTPLALLFHELATNASKYGALSTAEGCVHVTVALGPRDVTVAWVETGGPDVSEPARQGFGTRLIELSVDRQLGGAVERQWLPQGLAVTIRLPLSAMIRPIAARTA